ncbi:hypothetical protein CRG98_040587 [Punica granatum]|uniref:Aminotransferase-like plant mobile domain-containing protein n=1 Tax=Punica granatum TaxID=22663 RepID=A0A2I0I4X8_PUNGR|nr:hypothetical protein CRG98_040587 [Punica granatum]
MFYLVSGYEERVEEGFESRLTRWNPRKDVRTCHGFLLLVFGTVLFPNALTLVDGALAHVILQVVEGRSYVEALVAETLSWGAPWHPGGPMATGCPAITGLPLISQYGCTLVFPDRVIRQLGGLQDVPVEGNRAPYHIDLYFPEHPTNEERAYKATSSYVAQFHLQHPASIPRVQTAALEVETSNQVARRMELQSIWEELDRLHQEIAEVGTKLTDRRELQRGIAQARARARRARIGKPRI